MTTTVFWSLLGPLGIRLLKGYIHLQANLVEVSLHFLSLGVERGREKGEP